MPATFAAEPFSPLSAAMRLTGLLLLAVAAALAFVFAAAAAAVIGLVVAGAALTLRLAPKRVPVRAEVLEARQTPAGWVVEAGARRKPS
ncbi:MAG: hypothetical protein WDM79_10965 [Terricaulis sp.]